MSQRYDVLGVRIHALDSPGLLGEVERWIGSRARRYVCFTTVHGVMATLTDAHLQRVFNEGFAVPDGMPLVWLGQLRGHRTRRVYGPDIMLALCARAAEVGWPVFFLGGAEGVAERLAEALRRRFQGLRVVGAAGPPFREPRPEEEQSLVERLNASGAELVFVGLGCPKQERWMGANRERLTASVLLGVGAAFDFHTGRVPQAPRWMMHAGLEWFFRLLQEPRRLWRRYLILNPLFVAHVVLQLLGLRRYGSDASDPVDGAPPMV
jgi:N-acetylglucosaminyldiphosphoundecaprenol N-acetyl-beta-D-mannosaminyltransferase